VEGPEAINEVGGIYSNDPAAGELALEDIDGLGVVFMAEDGDQDHLVSDVEVGVAGRKPPFPISDKARHRQLENVQPFSILILGLKEPLIVLIEDEPVLIMSIPVLFIGA
jgi:hypothetical protein